jgi:PhnB protein
MTKVKPVPDGYGSVTPYLTIANAAAAIDFYKSAFGATERMRMAGPDGRIGHAELAIGTSVIMLSDEFPEMNCRGPRLLGGSPVALHVYVEDVDAVAKRAEAAGARITRPVADQFYGDRLGSLEDPFGHVWHIATHVEDVPPDEMERRSAKAMQEMAGDR